MSLNRCTNISGKHGWKWNKGVCFVGKNAKKKAIKQAFLIQEKNNIKLDSKQSENIFRDIIKQKRLSLNNRSEKKIKKNPAWLPPIALEKKYYKFIHDIMRQFSKITIQKIKPVLSSWNQENKAIIEDAWIDDLENINKEFQETQDFIFVENEENLKAEILDIAILVSIFNNKQWKKILKQTLGIEIFFVEEWEDLLLKTWVNRNVSLIKGLSNEYIKKINETIISGIDRGITSQELAKQLTQINRNFSSYRSNLIARDQINKLNSSLSRKRQKDVGIENYKWFTVGDERVRASHKVLNGKFCDWNNPDIYSEDRKTWKSRSNIGGVQLHPGQDIQCRCFGSPVFDDIINKIDDEINK